MSESILEVIQSLAPSVWRSFKENSNDTTTAAYIICQLLALYTNWEGSGAQPDAFLSYTEITNADVPGIKIANPNARVFIGENCKLNKVVISGTNDALIFFGKDASLNGCEIACHAKKNVFMAGYSCKLEELFTHIYAQHGFVVLSPGVTTQPGCNFCVQENSYILVGSDAMFSNNVFVRTSDSHAIYDLETRLRSNPARAVTLHPHTWVSRASTLNKGTEVGTHCIIGQGSVVHGKLLSNSIYSGAPVRQVRKHVTWDRKLGQELPEGHDYSQNHFLASFQENLKRVSARDLFYAYDFLAALSLNLANYPSDLLEKKNEFLETEQTFFNEVANSKEHILKYSTIAINLLSREVEGSS